MRLSKIFKNIFLNALDLEGNAAATLALSTSAAQTAALGEGAYEVWCDADCFLKVAPTANDVTTSNGFLLKANTPRTLMVRGNSKIGGIVSTGTPTLRYHRVG